MTDAGLISVMAASSCHQQAEDLGAGEQFQEALKLASMGGGGVEVEGKSASIKSISDSTQSSSSICLSSSLSRLSLSGSRRQLSIAPKWLAVLHESIKNERKGESDEPDAPLLLEGEDVAGEVDVVIGGEKRNEGNHKASASFKHSWRVDREAARPGLHRLRSPKQQLKILVRLYWKCQGVGLPATSGRA